MTKYIKLIALFFLYSFADKSFVTGILALPIHFQTEFLQNREVHSRQKKAASQLYCQTFIFGLFIFLYSGHSSNNFYGFKIGTPTEERALVSLIMGLTFAILFLTFELLFTKKIKK